MVRVIPLSLLLLTGSAFGDTYSCGGPDGRTVLQPKPCKRKSHAKIPPASPDVKPPVIQPPLTVHDDATGQWKDCHEDSRGWMVCKDPKPRQAK